MLIRRETFLKWSLYAAAVLLCFLIQSALLQRITIWGVLPFVYPLLAAIPAMYEGPVSGTAFSLAIGVICDLLLPAPLPCFYTLVFPLSGLCAAILSQSLLPAGFLCSLAGSAISFLLTDLFHCLLLWMDGMPAWNTGAFVLLREFCVSAPLVFPVTLLFRTVYRKTRFND